MFHSTNMVTNMVTTDMGTNILILCAGKCHLNLLDLVIDLMFSVKIIFCLSYIKSVPEL